MKARNSVAVFFLLLGFAPVSAQNISGTLDSRLEMGAGAGDAPDFSWGLEEFANIRFQARLRDRAVFYAAVNLAAQAGSSAVTAALVSAQTATVNYAGTLELERLYFRVPGEALQLDFGLMRIPFGYSLVWGPQEFLNPRDPLSTNARARGVLGALFSYYPDDDGKVAFFAAAPQNPFLEAGNGLRFGISGERHWARASLQGLYSYETPREATPLDAGSPWGIHRGGFSVKADIEIGFVAEALFTWNPDRDISIDGLSASAGLDYSILEGKLYVLAEYLFSGSASTTAEALRLSGHFLQALFRWSFDDYTNIALSCAVSFGDISFLPVLSFSTDISQGMTLTLSARTPLDRSVFSDGGRGVLGPLPPLLDALPEGQRRGSRFGFGANLRLKF